MKAHYVDKPTPTKKQILEIAERRLRDDNVPVPLQVIVVRPTRRT